jgi:hypothetical protein
MYESTDPNDYTWFKWKGPQGIPGDRGDDGTSVTLKGTVNSVSELP